MARWRDDDVALGLAKDLLRLPDIVRDAAAARETQSITAFATELATTFHAFYRDRRVRRSRPIHRLPLSACAGRRDARHARRVARRCWGSPLPTRCKRFPGGVHQISRHGSISRFVVATVADREKLALLAERRPDQPDAVPGKGSGSDA